MERAIIVVNPGSTSTKVALFNERGRVTGHTVNHRSEELIGFANVADQCDFRLGLVDDWLAGQPLCQYTIAAISGRGAPLCPLEGGVYRINEQMLDDVRTGRYSNHASNLGAIIAHCLGDRFDVPSFIVDPITVDEMTDVARVSGFPGIDRTCHLHVLNIKETCRRAAARLHKRIGQCRFVTVHMGGGVSVGAVDAGLIVDCNDALLGMGPFSPNRAGGLPIAPLTRLCYSGKYSESELLNLFLSKSGLEGYIGETDLRRVEERISHGDRKAELYYAAMIYQIAKETAAYATVFKGRFDAILLTGGMANSDKLVSMLTEYIDYLGPVVVIPGEHEMEALASGAWRVLNGEEEALEYRPVTTGELLPV